MSLEKQRAFIIHVIFTITLLGILYLGIKYLLPLLMPFVIGIIIAVLFSRLINSVTSKTKLNRTTVSILVLIVFYSIISFFIFLIGFKAVTIVGDIISNIPTLYKDTLIPALRSAEKDMLKAVPLMRPYLKDFMNNIDNSIFDFLSKTSSATVSTITGLAGHVPSLLIKLIFMIVSSFFFTIDYYRISNFIVSQFKDGHKKMLLKLKDDGLGTIVKFLRAYSIIICITFLELSLGFLIIGIPHPIIFGALIAVIDIMPIIGTGTVIIPWAVISLLMHNTKVGVGLIILYAVITVVRQTIEPRIVGQQIGLHPLVTLILMYVGAQLMGILGLFLLPIIATLLLQLNNEGTIHFLKREKINPDNSSS